MPNVDRTGPTGEGSQTGRRMGKCNPETKENQNNSFPNRSAGRGRNRRFQAGDESGLDKGMGRGMGKGMGRGFGRRS